jgi:tetratricopeptide (TPR) repeat protein
MILVGLDAADWLAIDPLIQAGKLRTFARLRARGRTGVLVSTPPLLSPIVWTTIATGRPPEEHGVLDFMTDLPGGGQVSVTASSRRVPALWNLVSNGGHSVAVVGWWATWPAESVRGTMVSDRVAPQLTRATVSLYAQAVAPASAVARLAGSVVRLEDVSFEDLGRYLPLTRGEYDAARLAARESGPRFYEDRVAHLAAVAAATRTYSNMAAALVASEPPDLLAVYLEGIDTVSHLFIRDARRGPQAILAAYGDADALVARLAAASAPDTWIVVCSDHGFQPANAGILEDPSDLVGPASAWHRPYGIVAVAEAGALVAESGATGAPVALESVTPLDIAPTLLHGLGLPVGNRMPGRVVGAMLPPEAAARPIARAAYADAGPVAPATMGPMDAEVTARLQALGYVGATPTSLARQNLGEILYRRGNLAGAERELRAVVEMQPSNLTALLWLAKALRDQARPREALRLYEGALTLREGSGEALLEAVTLAVGAHLDGDAQRILGSPAALRDKSANAHVARAVLARADGDTRRAETELRAALASDPVSFEALSRLLDLLGVSHRLREALPLFERAATTAARSPRHLALLGEVRLALGDAAAAEAVLAQALALAPDSSALRIDLARAQLVQHRLEAAIATLAPAEPSLERSVLNGAARSLQGRFAEAAREYQSALDKAPAPTPELLNGLGWAQLKLGHNREATELLRRSLALNKDQPEIDRLLAQLRSAPAAP